MLQDSLDLDIHAHNRASPLEQMCGYVDAHCLFIVALTAYDTLIAKKLRIASCSFGTLSPTNGCLKD
jgi:hypothetical protein